MEVESTTLLCCDCFNNDDPRCNVPQSDVALIAIGVTLGVIGVLVVIFIIWAAKKSGYLVNIRHRQSADPNIYGSFPEKKELPSTRGVESGEPIYDTISNFRSEIEVENPAEEFRNVHVLHSADSSSETDSIHLRVSGEILGKTSALAGTAVQQDFNRSETQQTSIVPNEFISSHNRSVHLPVEIKRSFTGSLDDLRSAKYTESKTRRHSSLRDFYNDVKPGGSPELNMDYIKEAVV